ncbi:MAG: pyridoxamine 5'-phosphate oxidase family protein [Actinobacteria bacterium]|nr:pyridoxamine 5'-phosphate oxidase family protein [Actinomycetota bacterium]
MASKYHRGEIEVQARASVREMAARISDVIRPGIPLYTRDFLEDQRTVVVGSTGANGRVWASLLTGEPGFLRVLDERTLRIDAQPVPGDPLDENLKRDVDVGLISVDLSSRRRMRLNGKAERRPEAIYVYAEQVYGNCPKYIQAREPETAGGSTIIEPGSACRAGTLTGEQRRLISSSDTFFIASAHPDGGADASHRGGLPGFVRFLDEDTLAFPDYSGNNMFNTLGNIAANPKAGLLFVDFERGDTLQLSGEARVIWDPARAAEFAGARRVVEFRIGEVVENTVPLRWRFAAYSPFNPA